MEKIDMLLLENNINSLCGKKIIKPLNFLIFIDVRSLRIFGKNLALN